jgi:hypothetical protein
LVAGSSMYISLGSPRMSNQDNNFTFLASMFGYFLPHFVRH